MSKVAKAPWEGKGLGSVRVEDFRRLRYPFTIYGRAYACVPP